MRRSKRAWPNGRRPPHTIHGDTGKCTSSTFSRRTGVATSTSSAAATLVMTTVPCESSPIPRFDQILTAKLCAGCRTHICGIALFDFRLSTLDCLRRAEDFKSVWLGPRSRIGRGSPRQGKTGGQFLGRQRLQFQLLSEFAETLGNEEVRRQICARAGFCASCCPMFLPSDFCFLLFSFQFLSSYKPVY